MKFILVVAVLFSTSAFAQASDSYTERLFRAKLGRSAPAVDQAGKAAKDKPAHSCGDCCKR